MKRTLIFLSLVANVVSVIALARVLDRDAREANLRDEAKPAPSIASASHQPSLDAEAWKKLQISDNQGFLARLRKEGFPPEIVRAVMMYHLKEQFRDRRDALLAKKKPYEYWKYRNWYPNDSETDGLDAVSLGQLRALDDEREALADSLLGPAPDGPGQAENRRRQYGDLTADQVRKISAINRDYSELKQQAWEESQGILLSTDREKFKYLEQACQADISATLSPEQWSEYCIRAGPTAESLQDHLRGFNATADEYQKLYSLQTAFDEKYGTVGLSPAQQSQRKDAEAGLLDEIKAALGPERFSDYQITTDDSYNQNLRFVTRSELSADLTNQLVSAQRDITQKSAAIKADSSLTPEQKYADLSTLADQAKAQVETLLGSDTSSRYQNDAGSWLTHIRPDKPSSLK